MRTDSNTVLPLSSSVSNKGTKLAQVSTDNGAAFERDFDKAKTDLEPKKPVVSESTKKSSITESKSSFVSQSEAPKGDEKDFASVIDEERLPPENASEPSDSSVSDAVISGKVLQSNGDLSPIPDTGIKLIKDDVALSSFDSSSAAILSSVASPFVESVDLEIASPLIAHNSVVTSEDKVHLDEVVLPAGSQMIVGFDGFSQSDLKSDLVSDVNSNGLLQPNVKVDGINASQMIDADDQFLVGIMAKADKTVPTKNIVELSELAAENNVTTILGADSFNGLAIANRGMSSNLAEDSVESVFAGSEDGSQLSWVLSQMDVSASKAADVSSGAESTLLDNVKVGAAAASLLAASMSKGAVSDSGLNSSLNNAAAVSEEVSTDSFLNEEIVLVDEPIELRKKEQEAFIGRMSVQIDGRVDDNDVGGLNSSLQNHGVNRLTSAMNVSAAPMSNPQSGLTMNLPPSHPGWAGEMSQKVAWLAKDGGHTAHIRLDPPELGSLTVKISVDNDANTQVSFLAATPQARDLLESQMSRLRDMLAQQGMDLSKADVDVSQQDASGTQRQAEHNARLNRNDFASDEADDELISSNLSYISASGVDYYA